MTESIDDSIDFDTYMEATESGKDADEAAKAAAAVANTASTKTRRHTESGGRDIETGGGVEAPLESRDAAIETIADVSVFSSGSFQEQIDGLIEERGVVLFSKTHCPFCLDVKDLLVNQIGVDVSVVEINTHSEGSAIHNYIKEKTGHKTVPAVFIKGEFIGGCDDLKALRAKGTLLEKLDGLIIKNHYDDTEHLETAKLIPMERGTAFHPPFWFPNVVNNYVVRLTGLQVFVLSVLSAAFGAMDDLWGQYIACGLLADFTLRMVAGSHVSPLGMVATFVSSPFTPQFRPGPPKQFAAFCGLMFSLLGTIFFFLDFEGHEYVGAAVMGMLAGASGLEAFLDFCLGCLFFGWGIQFGLIPDGVYRIYTSSRQETEDSWNYVNSKSNEPKPERVDTDPSSKIALRYKKKSDEWTKDDFHLVRNMQVTYFAMPLAISGMALALKISSDMRPSDLQPDDLRRYVVPEEVYWTVAAIAAAIFAVMLMLYVIRALQYPHKIATEWDCPLRSPSFGTITITLMIFAYLLYDQIDYDEESDEEAPQIIARVVYWIGAVGHALLTIAKMGEWIGRRLELEHVHASWMILPVGLAVSALVGVTIPMLKVEGDGSDIEQATNVLISRFYFSFSVLMWLALFFITFYKTVTEHNSDNRIRHGVWIWIAAPCVIAFADLFLCRAGSFVDEQRYAECNENFANYYFIGIFFFFCLCWATLPHIAFFGREKFGMGYWTECFALDTLAAAAAMFYAMNGYKTSEILMLIFLVIAGLANFTAFLHTATGIVRGRGIFTPEAKWGPLSFMKLTHEAFRGNLEMLRKCLADLDVDSNTESLSKFAAHYNRFFIVHEEHARHEDEVIFKTFNDYFHDHAKKWNDDHAEDHANMEVWRRMANDLLDVSTPTKDRKKTLDTLKEQLNEFFEHFLEHLKGEEDNLQPIARKYIPLALQKEISRKVFELTDAERWEVIIPYIVNNLPRHMQRIRYVKVLCWSMPERSQQIGAIIYRNVDAVMWERLRVEVPEMIPRGAGNWNRYY